MNGGTSGGADGRVARATAAGWWRLAAAHLAGGDHASSSDVTDAQRATALDALRTAVRCDEGLADAWLGLHHLDHEPDTALRAMAYHFDRFGEARRATGMALASRFTVGVDWRMRLETHDQLRVAVARQVCQQRAPGWRDSALGWLTGVDGGEIGACAAAVRGQVHLADENWGAAIAAYRRALTMTSTFGVGDATCGIAAALIASGLPDAGERLLRPLAEDVATPVVAAYAAYLMGLSQERRGDAAAARDWFAQCYSIDPFFPEVQDRLRLSGATEPGSAGPPVAAVSPIAAASPVAAGVTGAEAPAAGTPGTPGRPAGEGVVDELLAQLDAMIGLDDVKRRVRMLVSRIRIDRRRQEAGLPVGTTPGHMVFRGPPGTGKTTVARLIGRIYHDLGLLPADAFVEASRRTLVGEYLGHTATKTRGVLESALGGVLFIDEAYQLQIEGFSSGDAFGTEAIGELLAYMENHRSGLLVIVAGYTDEMARFLAANEGLRSRFTTMVDFPSYAPAELARILDSFVCANGDLLTPAARERACTVLDDVCAAGRIDVLGNGRFVRNLVEKAVEARALRLSTADLDTLPVDRLRELLAEDVEQAAGEVTAP